jgi:antitoxin PrlF
MKSESMTFGGARTMAASATKLVRIQEKGQVTLPVEVRRSLNLKKGDLVAVTQTDDGVLITPQEIVAAKALDRIGEALRATGLTLEELIESGREERGKILEEKYGIPNT